MFYRLKDKFRRFRFMMETSGILNTPALVTQPDSGLALLTQLQHKDVRMALIAFKSFAIKLPVGAVYILSDGSLTTDDFDLLRRHIPSVTFLKLEDHQSRHCPKGGCWERLLSITHLVKDHFVIQLDSDTLTLGDIPEIAECVKANRSFVIGTWDNQELETMASRQSEAAVHLRKSIKTPHIQLAAEANFNKLKRYNELQYVRGCAGFSGFAKGSFSRDFVEEISSQMSDALGDRWREWGSEQVMSNIVVANTPDCRVLPHPKYSDCIKMRLPVTVFVHFIGSCRFNNGIYARLGKNIIVLLSDNKMSNL
jgi:hypothetical protein